MPGPEQVDARHDDDQRPAGVDGQRDRLPTRVHVCRQTQEGEPEWGQGQCPASGHPAGTRRLPTDPRGAARPGRPESPEAARRPAASCGSRCPNGAHRNRASSAQRRMKPSTACRRRNACPTPTSASPDGEEFVDQDGPGAGVPGESRLCGNELRRPLRRHAQAGQNAVRVREKTTGEQEKGDHEDEQVLPRGRGPRIACPMWPVFPHPPDTRWLRTPAQPIAAYRCPGRRSGPVPTPPSPFANRETRPSARSDTWTAAARRRPGWSRWRHQPCERNGPQAGAKASNAAAAIAPTRPRSRRAK